MSVVLQTSLERHYIEYVVKIVYTIGPTKQSNVTRVHARKHTHKKH